MEVVEKISIPSWVMTELMVDSSLHSNSYPFPCFPKRLNAFLMLSQSCPIALLDISLGLLHRVQLPVPRHPAVVLAVLRNQILQPLCFSLTLGAGRLPRAIPRRLFQLQNHRVHLFALLLLGHHSEAIPFLRVLVLDVVQRVVERVGLHFFLDDAQDGAGFRVALDFELFDFDLLGRLGDDVEGIGGAVGGGVGARGLCVVEAEELDRLFGTTGGVVQARGEAETAVVLREGFVLVPITRQSEGREYGAAERTSALR
jgi:hypothetical protein